LQKRKLGVVKGDTMHDIGNKAINGVGAMAMQLLRDHQKEINEAYLSTDDPLSIALKLKIKPSQSGGVDLEMGIDFVAERIKDKVVRSINEAQGELFEEQPDRGDVVDAEFESDKEILFRQFNWGWPTQADLDACPYKKEPVEIPDNPPFFKRRTKRLAALLLKRF